MIYQLVEEIGKNIVKMWTDCKGIHTLFFPIFTINTSYQSGFEPCISLLISFCLAISSTRSFDLCIHKNNLSKKALKYQFFIEKLDSQRMIYLSRRQPWRSRNQLLCRGSPSINNTRLLRADALYLWHRKTICLLDSCCEEFKPGHLHTVMNFNNNNAKRLLSLSRLISSFYLNK